MNDKSHFRPPTDNVIFFDSEFSSNDPNTGEILSLALVTVEGEELYLELEYNGEVSDWVKLHILPTLTQPKITKDEARKAVVNFLNGKKPTLVTYFNSFDFVYLCKIFPFKDLPFATIPIDFASVLFSLGYDPDDYRSSRGQKFIRELGIDPEKYNLHNALDDARLLRDTYQKLLAR